MVEIKEWIENPMYLIYSDGRIFSKISNKFLKLPLDRYGYNKASLSVEKRRVYKTAHRLVAETFIPNPENKPQINHIDGNKQNNFVENLEWCTNNENIQHALKNGLKKIIIPSYEIYNSKLEIEEVKFIRRLWKLGMNQKGIGDLLNKSHKLIHKVVNNKSYTDVK